MTDIFISYARSTADQAHKVAEALRALGYGVWRDDELPAHRAYAEVIEERLAAAKAVVVIWSAEAVKSQWVFSEANRAREGTKLVQLSLDATRLPMPFDTLQCADMAGWDGDTNAPGWRKVVASLGDLIGAPEAPVVEAPALALPSKPSIAVMPFANLSNDPEQDYFADGMVEEIVGALSRFKSIFVIASGSTLSFKGKAVTPQEVSRLLGVRYILEGSVRQAGGRVRIAVKLIDATDGSQIWSERFDDTLEDVFALQDKVALSVAGVIEPTIQQAETHRAAKRPTENMGAYDLLLRSNALGWTYRREDNQQAINLVNRAIALDPDYALALAVSATWLSQSVGWGWSADPEGDTALAIARMNRALRLAGDDAEVLGHLGFAVLNLERDLSGASALAERAVTLNPGSSVTWLNRGTIRQVGGQSDLAAEDAQTSARLDPISPLRHIQAGIVGMARFQQRRFDEAAPLFREWIQLSDDPGGYALLASTMGHLGKLSVARELIDRCRALSPRSVEALGKYWYREPGQRKLFLEGIALAEGKEAPRNSLAP